METDSTLATLALLLSAVLYVITELGAAAIASRLQLSTGQGHSVLTGQFRPLRLVANLPGGPTAPLRLVNLMALTGAILAVCAYVVSIWGVRWDLIVVGAVVVLVSLAALTFIARSVGIRFSTPICTFMPRIAWLLSFPLRPLLLVEEIIVVNPRQGDVHQAADPALDFTLSVDTHDEPLDEHEVRMIRAVVQLDKTVAREIMVPRVDIVAAESGTTVDSLVETMNSAGHSRIPIYKNDLDHVVGVVHARDLLPRLAARGDELAIETGDVSREPLFIPESKTLEGLLEVFQETRTHMAIVIDEYGGVSGIVTIEDLLEEIVGEIRDEFDVEEPGIQRISDREFLVDAGMPVDDLNEALTVDVVGDGFDTIGGFVFDQLGTIPAAGDTVRHHGLVIEVVSITGRRPRTLRIRRVDGA